MSALKLFFAFFFVAPIIAHADAHADVGVTVCKENTGFAVIISRDVMLATAPVKEVKLELDGNTLQTYTAAQIANYWFDDRSLMIRAGNLPTPGTDEVGGERIVMQLGLIYKKPLSQKLKDNAVLSIYAYDIPGRTAPIKRGFTRFNCYDY